MPVCKPLQSGFLHIRQLHGLQLDLNAGGRVQQTPGNLGCQGRTRKAIRKIAFAGSLIDCRPGVSFFDPTILVDAVAIGLDASDEMAPKVSEQVCQKSVFSLVD